MARTTKAERKRRREAALVKITDGHGFADTVAYVMSEWGCSRSTARRDVHWAHGELQLGLEAMTFSTGDPPLHQPRQLAEG